MFDDFDTQIQSDELSWYGYDEWYQEWPQAPEEINPEEYDDWMASVYANQAT